MIAGIHCDPIVRNVQSVSVERVEMHRRGPADGPFEVIDNGSRTNPIIVSGD